MKEKGDFVKERKRGSMGYRGCADDFPAGPSMSKSTEGEGSSAKKNTLVENMGPLPRKRKSGQCDQGGNARWSKWESSKGVACFNAFRKEKETNSGRALSLEARWDYLKSRYSPVTVEIRGLAIESTQQPEPSGPG